MAAGSFRTPTDEFVVRVFAPAAARAEWIVMGFDAPAAWIDEQLSTPRELSEVATGHPDARLDLLPVARDASSASAAPLRVWPLKRRLALGGLQGVDMRVRGEPRGAGRAALRNGAVPAMLLDAGFVLVAVAPAALNVSPETAAGLVTEFQEEVRAYLASKPRGPTEPLVPENWCPLF